MAVKSRHKRLAPRKKGRYIKNYKDINHCNQSLECTGDKSILISHTTPSQDKDNHTTPRQDQDSHTTPIQDQDQDTVRPRIK